MNVTSSRAGVPSLAEQLAPLRRRFAAPGDERDAPEGGESPASDPLAEAARRERDYLRSRLREELGREPSEEEVSDYLRQHTEGY